MKIRTTAVLAVAALAAALFACEKSSDRGATTTTTTTAASMNADAVQQIAAARCDRELSCNNVGTGRKYVTRDSCIDELHGSVQSDLRGDQCGRVDRAQLDKCLADIRGERCDHPLDTIARLSACRTGTLCTK